MPSPVPSEDELVEVALEVGFSDAVIGSEGPAFEVGQDTMDPGEDDVGGH